MRHHPYQFDDRHLKDSFWSALNNGWEDMSYKWAFEQFWGKGAEPETIILSQKDFDALLDRINAPSDPVVTEKLRKVLERKAPWDS